jgi:hypothetical protein
MKRHLLIIAACLPLAGCFDYSDGDRVGTIVKFSYKGVICKTWEGELLIGGMKRKTQTSTDSNGNISSSSTMALNVMEFTVENPELIQPIINAMEAGKQVRLTYKQELFTICRSDGDDSFVQSIKVLE